MILESSGTYQIISQISDQKQQVTTWAQDLFSREDWCILDTECTGGGKSDEVCQIAVLGGSGEVLLNSLVKPARAMMNYHAQKVHGIQVSELWDQPSFDELLPRLLQAIGDRELIAYGKSYDYRMLIQSCEAVGIHIKPPDEHHWISGRRWYCAMRAYSRWLGLNQSQKLEGGDHSALGDCKATLELVRRLASE